MRLRDAVLLDVTDPLERHLPGAFDGVTIAQLLSHSSGLRAETAAVVGTHGGRQLRRARRLIAASGRPARAGTHRSRPAQPAGTAVSLHQCRVRAARRGGRPATRNAVGAGAGRGRARTAGPHAHHDAAAAHMPTDTPSTRSPTCCSSSPSTVPGRWRRPTAVDDRSGPGPLDCVPDGRRQRAVGGDAARDAGAAGLGRPAGGTLDRSPRSGSAGLELRRCAQLRARRLDAGLSRHHPDGSGERRRRGRDGQCHVRPAAHDLEELTRILAEQEPPLVAAWTPAPAPRAPSPHSAAGTGAPRPSRSERSDPQNCPSNPSRRAAGRRAFTPTPTAPGPVRTATSRARRYASAATGLAIHRHDRRRAGLLEVTSFIFTRTPYDPQADVPGGIDPQGWHAPGGPESAT